MAVLFALPAMLPTPSSAATEPEPAPEPQLTDADGAAILASWHGGLLTRSELDTWLVAFGPVEVETDAIREAALAESLAAAYESSLDDARRRAFEIALQSHRSHLLAPVLQDHVVKQRLRVEPAEIDAALEKKPQVFVRPAKMNLRNLFKSLGDEESAPAVRAAMDEIHRRLVDGADFDRLAQDESESQSRFRGGRLGWIETDSLPPALAEAVRGLQPGQLTKPLEHGGGLTIFLCEDIRPARVPSAEEAKAKLRLNLERRRRNEILQELEDELLKDLRLDLTALSAAAQGGPEGAEAQDAEPAVLSIPGYRLTADDAERILRVGRGERTPSTTEQVENRLRDWAYGVAASRRATTLGLDREPEMAARLAWLEVHLPARLELKQRVDARLTEPDVDALRAWYDAHLDHFQRQASYDLSVVHFGGLDALKQADAVVDELSSGKLSFEEAARRHSQDPSAADGGRWEPRTISQLVAMGTAASKAIKALDTGETTRLLNLESGLWIFRLDGRNPAHTASFDEALPQIRLELRKHRIGELELEVRHEHLKSIGFRLGPPPAAEPVVLRWTTANEHECFGYHVYRGMSEDGPFERLTDEVVAGGGTTDLKRSYAFEDPGVEAGRTYYYYVETVRTDGHKRRLTPVRAVLAKASPSTGEAANGTVEVPTNEP